MNRNLEAGSVIGEYVLDTYLGAGGFGAVWRAHHQSTGEDAAVKFLTGAGSQGTAAMRADIELLAAAAASRSPHVVRVLGGGDQPVPYIVMEYVDGTDLGVLLRDNYRLTVERTLDIGLGMADALRGINEAGIVHRDIKPSNVMVDKSGVIKLADFGIAKIVGYETVTMTGQVAMTMAYAAPEVWEDDSGSSGRPTHKSDLYALGVLLYECLAGATPFRGSYGTLYRAHRESPPDIASLPSDVPASLRELIRRCLAKAPADRPADARECLRYLERARLEREESQGIAPAGEPTRFGNWLRVSPHPSQAWAWRCRQENTGAVATVEVHFVDDLEYGARLRRAVVAGARLVPLGAERILDTNRLILRPGEAWAGGPDTPFQFWVARQEELSGSAGTAAAAVNVALLRKAAGSLIALIEAAEQEGIKLAFQPQDTALQADGSVYLRRPGLVESEVDAAKSAMAFLNTVPLDAPARELLASAGELRDVAPRAQNFGTASIADSRTVVVEEDDTAIDATVICSNCRAAVPEHEPFCNRCGHPMGRASGPSCPRCRAPHAPDDVFCANCGQPLARRQQSLCPRCQAPFGQGDPFCGNCGQRLVAESAPAPQAVPPPLSPLQPEEQKRRWPFSRGGKG